MFKAYSIPDVDRLMFRISLFFFLQFEILFLVVVSFLHRENYSHREDANPRAGWSGSFRARYPRPRARFRFRRIKWGK